MPAEADADVRARVDQILNRPVTVNVEQAPRKEVLNLVAGQARLRYELDEKTIVKADVNLGKPMTPEGRSVAARNALAEVLGTVGLSYRVTEDGTLFVTTAARLAEDAAKKGAVIEGPPIKLTLSQPLKASNPSYRELTPRLVRPTAGEARLARGSAPFAARPVRRSSVRAGRPDRPGPFFPRRDRRGRAPGRFPRTRKSWCARPLWFCTVSTLVCKTEPESLCSD